MNDARYIAADAEEQPERRRLELLQLLWDAITMRRLDALGLGVGWRCLEVAGGAGSVARLLAARVRESGRVVVTDVDPRFLALGDVPNVEVRKHDILVDPLEEHAFDLVHCRSVLMHLAEPARAIERMLGAVRPGGWLVVEEPDYSTVSVAGSHPAADDFDLTWAGIRATLKARGLANPDFGSSLPERLGAAGLTGVTNEGVTQVYRGGGDAAEFAKLHVGLLVAAGVLGEADAKRLDALYDDPQFTWVDAALYGAWGRRAD